MLLRKALTTEAKECYGFIEDARGYHTSMGFEQWHPGYPTLKTIVDDIAAKIGFVFCENEQLLGYCCIVIGEEPAYQNIKGSWSNSKPYAVVHRMTFGDQARGQKLSGEAFNCIKDYCRLNGIDTIRVDTQEENKVMKHILQREGFRYCGLVVFDGGPKLAYDWQCKDA